MTAHPLVGCDLAVVGAALQGAESAHWGRRPMEGGQVANPELLLYSRSSEDRARRCAFFPNCPESLDGGDMRGR